MTKILFRTFSTTAVFVDIHRLPLMNHVKIIKGWPPRDAPSKLVQLWYKIFEGDQRVLVEMKIPHRLSDNKTSLARSCAEDQILENKISGT